MNNITKIICKLYVFFIMISCIFTNQFIAQENPYLNSLVATTPLKSMNFCSNTSNAYTKKYMLQSTYIPKKNDPLITLKITVHIFKPDSDVGNWQMNTNKINGLPAIKAFLDPITNGKQERYSAARKATYEVSNYNLIYIADSKIAYEITNIYFYSKNELYTVDNDQALFEHIKLTDSSRLDEGLPLVFNGGSGPGHLSSYNGNSAIVTTLNAFDPVFGRSHLLHEIGHAFGLGHTYANGVNGGSDWQNFNGACDSPDYLSDVFPNNNPFCQNEGKTPSKPTNAPCFSCYESTPDTSNNLMGGQRYNRWMSPLQMGRRIRSMHLNSNAGRNIRQFAKDMESNHKNYWQIDTDETWDFDIQLYKDIVVKAGVTLTIKCKTALSINGKIKLEKGAKLIVDGGEITGWCKTGLWRGIELPLKKKNYRDNYKNYIEIKNGGKITKNKMQINGY